MLGEEGAIRVLTMLFFSDVIPVLSGCETFHHVPRKNKTHVSGFRIQMKGTLEVDDHCTVTLDPGRDDDGAKQGICKKY